MTIRMKPRIYRSGDRWICFNLRAGMRCAAAGSCPESAYRNWEACYG